MHRGRGRGRGAQRGKGSFPLHIGPSRTGKFASTKDDHMPTSISMRQERDERARQAEEAEYRGPPPPGKDLIQVKLQGSPCLKQTMLIQYFRLNMYSQEKNCYLVDWKTRGRSMTSAGSIGSISPVIHPTYSTFVANLCLAYKRHLTQLTGQSATCVCPMTALMSIF